MCGWNMSLSSSLSRPNITAVAVRRKSRRRKQLLPMARVSSKAQERSDCRKVSYKCLLLCMKLAMQTCHRPLTLLFYASQISQSSISQRA